MDSQGQVMTERARAQRVLAASFDSDSETDYLPVGSVVLLTERRQSGHRATWYEAPSGVVYFERWSPARRSTLYRTTVTPAQVEAAARAGVKADI